MDLLVAHRSPSRCCPDASLAVFYRNASTSLCARKPLSVSHQLPALPARAVHFSRSPRPACAYVPRKPRIQSTANSLSWHPSSPPLAAPLQQQQQQRQSSSRSPGPPGEDTGDAAGPEGPRVPTKDSIVGPTAETSPAVRFAWYASEAFGKAVALVRGRAAQAGAAEAEAGGAALGEAGRPLSRKEAVEMLKKDYDKSYFVTGAMTMELYEPECEFADPFVSFRGRDRFKQNVSNLGSFMEEVSLKILDWQESEDKLTTRWRFSCVLGLPWRPILAASGGTDHFFDGETGRIYKHVERWDISPVDGLRQLVKPNPKLRTRQKANK